MRKLTVAAILLALAFTASPAMAKRQMAPSATQHDSSWLSKEANMTSNIDQAISDVPLGAIVAFNYNSEPTQYTTNGIPDYVLCDGRAIPAQSDLCKVAGQCGNTPNLNSGGLGTSGLGFFLRGGNVAQQQVTDTFEYHNHEMAHNHYFEGRLTSDALTADLDDTTIKGTAEAQKVTYKYTALDLSGTTIPTGSSGSTNTAGSHGHWFGTPSWGAGWVSGYTDTSGSHSHTVKWNSTNTLGSKDELAKSEESAVAGEVVNGHSRGRLESTRVIGTTEQPDNRYTAITGNDETAPTYHTVRYYMRVNN